jgi:hypothetical protein
MKRFRFRRAAIATVSVGLLASTSAFAGQLSGQSVVIFDANHLANGDLGFVHNSSDRVQYIGCQLGGGFGYCYAMNSAGINRTCFTFDPTMISTLRSLKSDSYLIFHWNDSGTCTGVQVINDSSPAPMKAGMIP